MAIPNKSNIKIKRSDEILVQNQDLKAELKKYQIIADNAYDMVRWLLPDMTLAYISPSCQKITGYTQEEHYENPLLLIEIIHPEDRKNFENQLNDAYEGQESEPDLVRIITKNGDLKWIGIAVQKVFSAKGQHLGYRTSTRDMTSIHLLPLKRKIIPDLKCSLKRPMRFTQK